MNSGIKQLVLVIGGPYGFSDAVYKKAIAKISNAGINIVEKQVSEIEEMHKILSEHGTTVAYEGYSQWKHLIEKNRDLMDINVLNRMLQGKLMKIESIKIVKEAQKQLSEKLYSN